MDVIVDQANIGGVIEMVRANSDSLKVLELNRFLKEKLKMLPIDEIIAGLKQVDTIIFRDAKLRLGPTLTNAFNKFIMAQSKMRRLEIEC